jgi:hypothetical protein
MSDTRKTAQLRIRLTPSHLAKIHVNAAAHGMNASEYLRRLALTDKAQR